MISLGSILDASISEDGEVPEDTPIRVLIENDPAEVSGIAFRAVTVDVDDSGRFLVIHAKVILEGEDWPEWDRQQGDIKSGASVFATSFAEDDEQCEECGYQFGRNDRVLLPFGGDSEVVACSKRCAQSLRDRPRGIAVNGEAAGIINDLVSALENLHDACEHWEDQDDPVLLAARAAIAKAKGESQ